MKRWRNYIERWLDSMLMLLLLTGCASSSDEEGEEHPKEKPVLKLYLFSPDSPIVTRGEVGDVKASDEEKRINTLDVWVFETGTDVLVSYIHLANLTIEGSREISMEISDAFAQKASNISTRPNVDIFVVANISSTNCGLTFTRETTPGQLKNALIEHKTEGDFFGVTSPVNSVPLDGLPMSGFLEDQSILGSSPVFQATDDEGHLSVVRLVRAVSKIRFIFSKSTSAPEILISNISLTKTGDHPGVLPTQEYLFLREPYDYPNVLKQCHLPDNPTYEGFGAILISNVSGDAINACNDPASYEFVKESETGQQYENRIDRALKEQTVEEVVKPAQLSELGRFYLRESDIKIAGQIQYRIGEGAASKTVTFDMAADGDFTRNHTWIVYGYFLGSGALVMNLVDVKAWDPDEDTGIIYNW